jgi:hypothetical protein
MLKRNQMFTKYVNIFHMVYAADAHQVKGQVLREEPTVNKGKSLRPGVHQGNWKLQLNFNYSNFSVENQLLLECVYVKETGSLLVAQ